MRTRQFGAWALAAALSVLLAACGGGTSGSGASSTKTSGPIGGRVESYTPDLPTTRALNIKDLGTDSPKPSAQIVLASAAREVAQAKAANSVASAGKPPQIGVGRKIGELASGSDFGQRLQWSAGRNGSQLASVRFVSADAAGLRLALAVTSLDPRTLLRVYGKSATTATEVTGLEVLDTIYRNLAEKPGDATSRLYYTPYVAGDEVTLEIELPKGVATSSLDLAVPRLSHLYASPESDSSLLKINNSGVCEVDVACRNTDWGSTGNGTARMVFSDAASGGSYLCSGTLLNDRNSSGTPYFLTASHCFSDQASASTLQTFWFYRASSCGSLDLYSGTQTLTGGATLLYTSIATDTTFVRLNATPPAGVTFKGWSTDLVTAQSSVGGVHHPKGDVQKVSLGQTVGYASCTLTPGSTSFSCAYTSSASGTSHLRVGWTSGVTEGGSSGSGVFQVINGGRYLVGQLSGGSSSCSNTTGTDVYGRFDIAYTAALYQWLDGSATGGGGSGTRSPVYRFYNTSTGAHFFTGSASERDSVIANLPQFRYEGTAFYAYASTGTGLEGVYRFFNTQNSTHFYTISSAERAYINQNYLWYRDEGTAWYAKSASDGSNSPLYRFFNNDTSSHFYTMSAAERDSIIANLKQFRYEGVAYYAWISQ